MVRSEWRSKSLFYLHPYYFLIFLPSLALPSSPQVRAVPVEDKSAAIDTVTRERATSEPGSIGAPMSGVVVEVRVTEGHEIKRGDIICVLSAMKVDKYIFDLTNSQTQKRPPFLDGECRICACLRTR